MRAARQALADALAALDALDVQDPAIGAETVLSMVKLLGAVRAFLAEPEPERPVVPDALHEVASDAAWQHFRYHPGAWQQALPSALDVYRKIVAAAEPEPEATYEQVPGAWLRAPRRVPGYGVVWTAYSNDRTDQGYDPDDEPVFRRVPADRNEGDNRG